MDRIRVEHPSGGAPFRVPYPELLHAQTILMWFRRHPGFQLIQVDCEKKLFHKSRSAVRVKRAPEGRAAHVLQEHETIPAHAIREPVSTQYQAPVLVWRRFRG